MPSHADEYKAATEAAALFDLSDYGKIGLTGPDARIFLHNLCTQDVRNLPSGVGCEAFLTTNKARVLAHVWIGHQETAAGSSVLLDMVAGQAEKVLTHLNHYLISEKVELSDLTREFGMLRLVGPRSASVLAKISDAPFATLKPLHHLMVPALGCIRRQLLLGMEGYDLFCQAAQVGALRDRLLAAGAAPAGTATYQLLRIEAGLPEYGIDIDETRLAMETGRAAQSISYTKGCYLGQETIVMARDRGQVNRLLLGVKVAGDAALANGTKLFRAGEEVGQVTSSVLSPRVGQVIAMAYLRRGSWEPGTELVIEPQTDGRAAVVCALPFFSDADVVTA